MIVPQFWAEGRAQHKEKGKQITIRRFGWSDTSQAEAQAMADTRAREGLERAVAGAKLERRELKTPYNGAQGVPIREEIVSRHGETLVTRNSYGARCLNTPNVLFADIDYKEPGDGCGLLTWILLGGVLIATLARYKTHSTGLTITLIVATVILGPYLSRFLQKQKQPTREEEEKMARERIDQFIAAHPDWHVRLYRTPNGLRVLAMHRTFDPTEAAVQECFKALGTDRLYVQMCNNQRCFRARVSPKPWRIGISQHMRPRPGIWPVAPERLHLRQDWIAHYEEKARSFAACTFIADIGSSAVHPAADAVRELHDEMCRAESALPIA